MASLSLVFVLASALVADLSPEELIGRLGSSDRVVREEAARTLEEQGVDALPALRAAYEAAEAHEARERLAELITQGEARALARPTLVRLELDDRPLGEAVETLAARSGFRLALADPTLADRRVTIRFPEPSPFWEAVDRLGRAGGVRHDPGPRRNRFGKDPEASTIRLVVGDPPAFTAYSGPLRVHLFAVHRHRDLDFQVSNAARTPQKKRVETTVEIQAFAEPGRFLNANGLPRLEAVDGQGRTISSPSGGGESLNAFERSWLVPGELSLLHWQVPIGLPDPPAPSLMKLRGVLPVVLSSRRPDPLVIPLVDVEGKTFRLGRSVVRVEKVLPSGPRTTMVNLVLREEASPADRSRISAGPEADFVGDYLRDRMEFLDAEGRPLGWLLPGNRPSPAPNGELRAQTLVSGDVPPARLRLYRLHRLATEIPFEFSDVPTP